MPYLTIQTNITLTSEQQTAVLTGASQQVAQLLGKAEQYVMVALQMHTPMYFAGSDEPTAFVTLKSIRLPTTRASELTQQLTRWLTQTVLIPKERIYIELIDVEAGLWGWNERTFAG